VGFVLLVRGHGEGTREGSRRLRQRRRLGPERRQRTPQSASRGGITRSQMCAARRPCQGPSALS
jgi:hypothetical protein